MSFYQMSKGPLIKKSLNCPWIRGGIEPLTLDLFYETPFEIFTLHVNNKLVCFSAPDKITPPPLYT